MFTELIQILMNSVSALLSALFWLFKLKVRMFSCDIFGIQEYTMESYYFVRVAI